jgi:hypothetical protein
MKDEGHEAVAVARLVSVGSIAKKSLKRNRKTIDETSIATIQRVTILRGYDYV